MDKKVFSFILVLVMVFGVIAPVFAQGADTPLVFGNGAFSQKFSPFYNQTVYDRNVEEITQVSLMATDRVGGIIFNAIEGETRPYNGVDYTYHGIADLSVKYDDATDITTYTAKLRDDIKFSDGVPLTADDLIFSYYVYLDPAYVGSTTLSSYKIIGLQDYMTQTTSEVYAKLETTANAIFEAGPDHEWAEGDAWTKDQQDYYWSLIEGGWKNEVQKIVDIVFNKYAAGNAEETLGYTAEEVGKDDGLKVALGMALWGFGEVGEDGLLKASKSEMTFDYKNGQSPTLEDFYHETYLAYEGDPDAFFSTEAADSKAKSITASAKDTFIFEEAKKMPEMAAGIPNVEGIKKLDDYTVEVKTYGYEAPAVYTILGIYVSPLHYYGDKAQYDYENNKFGHPFGDLSLVQAKTTQPMGAGPYKFIKYENRVAYFEANEGYFEGAPKTKYFQYKETQDSEYIPGISTGTIDGTGNVSGSKSTYEQVAKENSNGDITGDVVTTYRVDNRGYGYIGINANNVNVAGDPASEESRNLRRAIATVMSVYRNVAIDSYYGNAASVINYPISNTSWAAPQPTDPDYKVAFSTDVNGDPIYTSDMDQESKYAAALEAARGFFEAAGYTFGDDGKMTAAPEGAKMTYEVIIGASGTGDHPSFAILTDAANGFAELGFTLKINDPSDGSILWSTLDSGKAELWVAAWQTTIDPDMYQVYHSKNMLGAGGSDSNKYMINDSELDQYIMDARKSDDQAYRKQVYKSALDVIIDWAVEIPTYQRQNASMISTQRVDVPTFTPDITTYYEWTAEMINIQMAATK